MSFLSIMLALLIEQIRPLGRRHPVRQWVPELIYTTRRYLDAGRWGDALLVGGVLVLAPALLAVLMQWVLGSLLGWWAVLVWNVVVLYFTLGFRQFSYHLTDIRKALDDNNEYLARQLLAQWRHLDTREFMRGHIYQRVMEASTLAAHRSVFGVFFWYAVASAFGVGPAGAVMYRSCELAYRMFHRHGESQSVVNPHLLALFAKAWALIDWVPVRLSAISFAMVGNFEEVVERWRALPQTDPAPSVAANERVLLSASFSAINAAAPNAAVAITDLASTDRQGQAGVMTVASEPRLGMTELNLLIGLVWRALILWMLLLALLSAANLLG